MNATERMQLGLLGGEEGCGLRTIFGFNLWQLRFLGVGQFGLVRVPASPRVGKKGHLGGGGGGGHLGRATVQPGLLSPTWLSTKPT